MRAHHAGYADAGAHPGGKARALRDDLSRDLAHLSEEIPLGRPGMALLSTGEDGATEADNRGHGALNPHVEGEDGGGLGDGLDSQRRAPNAATHAR